MKKIISSFILTVFAVTLVLPFAAYCENGLNPPVVDNAGLLTAEEFENLSSWLSEVREIYGYDVAIYTENENPLETATARCNDLYINNGYGMGENGRGLMFYISTSSGRYNILSFPEGETYLSDEACNYIAERCAPYLNNRDFYNAFLKYYLVTTDLFEKELAGETLSFGKNPPVVDNAGLLTTEELVEISDILYDIRETYDIDVSIYTENETDNSDAVAKADNIYDYTGYGMGENDRGMLYYVCMSTRKYALSTHPYGKTPFSNSTCDYIGSSCLEYLSNDDYYNTFLTYSEIARNILETNENSGNIDYDVYPYSGKRGGEKHYVALIILLVVVPLAASLIVVLYKQSKMDTAVKQAFATQYQKPGSMNIEHAADIFLYSHVSRTRRQESSSGSGSHTSSSGRSHGGSSGSF